MHIFNSPGQAFLSLDPKQTHATQRSSTQRPAFPDAEPSGFSLCTN